MKSIFTLLSALLLAWSFQSCMVSHKPNSSFFDNPYYDNKGAEFTSINVPMFLAKPFAKKALREEGGNEELINLIKKISDVKVMTVENGNREMLADYTNYLTRNNYDEWMTVKKDTEVIKFQAKQKGDLIKNLLITVNSGNELVFVDVSGKFTADDISKIINYSEKKDVKNLVSK